MAFKKITDLQLISEVTNDVNFAVDDGIQTYRTTGSQVKDYILPAAGLARNKLAVGAIARSFLSVKTATYTVDTDVDDVIICDCTSNNITLNLPAASGRTGKIITVKKKDANTSGFKVTVDANSTELIDSSLTNTLFFPNESRMYICDGFGWRTISKYFGESLAVSFASSQATASFAGIIFREERRLRAELISSLTGNLSGSGLTLTIPSAYLADYDFTGGKLYDIGRMLFRDNTGSVATANGVAILDSNNSITIRIVGAPTGQVSSSAPWAWNPGDSMSLTLEFNAVGF